MSDESFRLAARPVQLGRGATAEILEFDGSGEWYARYSAAHADDGPEGRLVSMHTFESPWDTWEMHPVGHELVVCTAGRMTLHQELGSGVHTVGLQAGEAGVNPPGVWPTADVDEPATALFVTAGEGTELRPR